MLFFFVHVFVYASVTLLNDRYYAHDFAMKALEYGNDSDRAGKRKVCSCAFTFNFLHMPPNGDTTKCQVQKWQNLGFSTARVRQNKLIKTKVGM